MHRVRPARTGMTTVAVAIVAGGLGTTLRSLAVGDPTNGQLPSSTDPTPTA